MRQRLHNFATYIEQVSDLLAYGGKSLHEQSHGESFIALFANRFEQGIYILDEPEAALSPQRQLSFLKIVHDLASPGHAQFLIATHSRFSRLPGRSAIRPRRGYYPGNQLSRDQALPSHPRLSQCAGEVFQASLRPRGHPESTVGKLTRG